MVKTPDAGIKNIIIRWYQINLRVKKVKLNPSVRAEKGLNRYSRLKGPH